MNEPLLNQNQRQEEEQSQTQSQSQNQNQIQLRKNSQLFYHIYRVPSIENEPAVMRKLLIVSAVCFTLMVGEVIGGYLANSLSIMNDAAHLLSDLCGLFFSIFSIVLSKKAATDLMTFGFHRAQVIGAMASVVIIWSLTLILVWKATERLIRQDFEVDGFIMLVTAVFALIANLVMAKILHSGGGEGGHGHSHGFDSGHQQKKQKKQVLLKDAPKSIHHEHEHEHFDNTAFSRQQNISMQAIDNKESKKQQTDESFLLQPNQQSELVAADQKDAEIKQVDASQKNLSVVHESENVSLRASMINILGDTIQSSCVIVAAVIVFVWQTPPGSKNPNKAKLADPICTYVFAVLVMLTTVQIVKDCLLTLMEGTPSGLNYAEFATQLKELPGIVEVHDLHVWEIQIGKPCLSAHITTDSKQSDALKNATNLCRKNGIYHSTIQVEQVGYSPSQKHERCEQNVHTPNQMLAQL